MPLKKGKSKKVISENIGELERTPATETRQKGIDTLARKRGISRKKAKQIQSVAISYSEAEKSKKSKRSKRSKKSKKSKK